MCNFILVGLLYMYHIGFNIIYKLHQRFHQDRYPLSKKAELFVLYKIYRHLSEFFLLILGTFGFLDYYALEYFASCFNQSSFDVVFFQLFSNYVYFGKPSFEIETFFSTMYYLKQFVSIVIHT